MSATDKLYFPPTGEETSHYLLVTVSEGSGGGLQGRVSVEKPGQPQEGAESAPPQYEGATEGGLATVLKEADEFAALRGYPLRLAKPDDVEFPAELGTYAERQIGG